jgi:hypothetical protein
MEWNCVKRKEPETHPRAQHWRVWRRANTTAGAGVTSYLALQCAILTRDRTVYDALLRNLLSET